MTILLDDERKSQAAEFALGLMEGTERRAFEADLATSPELRSEVAQWQEVLTNFTTEVVKPPARVKAKLDARLFPKSKQQGRPWLAAMLTGLTAAAFVVFLALPIDPDYSVQVSGDGVEFLADVSDDRRILNVSALVANVPSDRDAELWIIPKDAAPISLGILSAGDVIVPGDFEFTGALLAVSVEQKGGSPTGAPTTQPIAVQAITTL